VSSTVASTHERLTRYLTENPEALAKSFARKEKLYYTASIISGLASTIIFFSAPMIASVLLGETYLLLKIAGVVLIAGVCLAGFGTFDEWGTEACYKKVMYQLIADETKQIKQSGEAGVQQIFKSCGRTIEQIPSATQEALAKMNLANRWETVVPLVARYQVGNNKAKAKILADQQLHKLRPSFIDVYCNIQKKQCGAFLGLS